MKIGEIKIQFAPVPDGTRWQVFIQRQTTTLDMVTVDHDELGVPHDPDSLNALDEAIETRARELLAQGHSRRIGSPTQDVTVVTWSPEGSASARQDMDRLSARFTPSEPTPEDA